jgi:hypothetical protein
MCFKITIVLIFFCAIIADLGFMETLQLKKRSNCCVVIRLALSLFDLATMLDVMQLLSWMQIMQ